MEKLKQIIQNLSAFIESGVTMSGDAKFSISEVCDLRNFIGKLEKEVTELEKVNNYNKSAETFNEPKDREIKGKAPSISEKPEPNKKVTGNMVNHPLHYQSNDVNGNHLECIDVMEAVKGWYPTALFCELNAFKYNWRVGQKDFTPTELAKIGWYSDKACNLWRENLKWFYPKKQHYYAIIDDVKIKNPVTKEWQDAVLYTDGKGKYVRGTSDFIYKFKKV